MSFWSVTLTLMEGLPTLFRLFFLTILFAMPLGLLICLGTMSTWKPLAFLGRKLPINKEQLAGNQRFLYAVSNFSPISTIFRVIVWIIRGSPLLLQILIVFYGPGLLFGWKLLPRFTAALVTFVINYACYFSEIYRGGIQSIPHGQKEAGDVLGMTRTQIFFKVTLLQLVKRIVPPMGNELITLVKDTALVRVISVYELIWMGESFIKKGYIWPLFYTGAFYLILNGILTLLLGWSEKKLSFFR